MTASDLHTSSQKPLQEGGRPYMTDATHDACEIAQGTARVPNFLLSLPDWIGTNVQVFENIYHPKKLNCRSETLVGVALHSRPPSSLPRLPSGSLSSAAIRA
jgi:hypothetical protein